jgi:hypothetical protein
MQGFHGDRSTLPYRHGPKDAKIGGVCEILRNRDRRDAELEPADAEAQGAS